MRWESWWSQNGGSLTNFRWDCVVLLYIIGVLWQPRSVAGDRKRWGNKILFIKSTQGGRPSDKYPHLMTSLYNCDRPLWSGLLGRCRSSKVWTGKWDVRHCWMEVDGCPLKGWYMSVHLVWTACQLPTSRDQAAQSFPSPLSPLCDHLLIDEWAFHIDIRGYQIACEARLGRIGHPVSIQHSQCCYKLPRQCHAKQSLQPLPNDLADLKLEIPSGFNFRPYSRWPMTLCQSTDWMRT